MWSFSPQSSCPDVRSANNECFDDRGVIQGWIAKVGILAAELGLRPNILWPGEGDSIVGSPWIFVMGDGGCMRHTEEGWVANHSC